MCVMRFYVPRAKLLCYLKAVPCVCDYCITFNQDGKKNYIKS